MLNKRQGDETAGSGYTFLNGQRQVVSTYDVLNTAWQRGLTTDYALQFKHTFTPQTHELSAQAHFNRSRDNSLDAFTAAPGLTPPDGFPGDSRNLIGMLTRQGDAQVDYTRQLSKGTKLETGWKGILRRLDNTQGVDSLEGGVTVPSAHQDNNFSYDENVQAAYALLTRQVGGKVTLQGGLRAERATTTFRLANPAQSFPNNYTSLFPSAAATFQLSQQDQVRFSYSKRIQRPDAWRLNPFPMQQTQFDVFVGNPSLKPEYTHSYEASFQHSASFGSLTLTPFYRHAVNAVRRFIVSGSPDSTGIQVDTMTFRNLATANSYGVDFNAQARAGTRLTAMVGGSAFRLVTDASNLNTGQGINALAWSARGSVTLHLSPNTDVQWFQYYRAPQKTEQGRIGSFSMANVAIRQKLSSHASLNLRVSDPFDQMHFYSLTEDPGYTLTSDRRFDARTVYLTFSYNFGHPPRLRLPQPDQQPAPTTDPTAGVPGGPGGR
jgi:outer membrane receptor protein involved in Fe transport